MATLPPRLIDRMLVALDIEVTAPTNSDDKKQVAIAAKRD